MLNIRTCLRTYVLYVVMEGSLDTVVSASQQNMVLGIGQFSHELLVFTLLHGVVSIVHSAKSHTSSIKISSTRFVQHNIMCSPQIMHGDRHSKCLSRTRTCTLIYMSWSFLLEKMSLC